MEGKKSRQINVILPNGKMMNGHSFVTTPLDIAKKISKKVLEAAIVAKIKYLNTDPSIYNQEVVDLDQFEKEKGDEFRLIDIFQPLVGDCHLQILDFETKEGKMVFWHSSAHILGRSLEKNFGTMLTHGPPLLNGFFYDGYNGNSSITPNHYIEIQEKMSQLTQQNLPFQKLYVTKEQALDLFQDNPFKVQTIEHKVHRKGMTTIYKCGDFIDLCTGPHINSTNKVKALKILKNSSSYWLGNSQNDMLQRVYGISFPSKKQLDDYI